MTAHPVLLAGLKGWVFACISAVALGLFGCLPSAEGPIGPVAATQPQEYVRRTVQSHALPHWEEFRPYWNHRAAELLPFDGADRVAAGTVVGNTWTNEVRDAQQFYRALNTGKQEFRMVANVEVIGGSTTDRRENLRVEYSLIEGVGLTGLEPCALAPGQDYLLLLQRQASGFRLVPVEEDGPPPIPIAVEATDTRPDAAQLAGVTRLLLASLRAGDDEVSRYAVPVLGHLAGVYGRQDAQAELLAVAQGDDGVLAVAAIESLTASGSAGVDVHRTLEQQTDSGVPAIRSAAVVARLDLGDTTVLPAIVAWSKDVACPPTIVERLAAGLQGLPEQVVVTELLPHADALLETTVPVPIRRAVAWKLAQHAGAEVAPVLAGALHDPDTRVAHDAMMGLFRAANGEGDPEMCQHIPGLAEFELDPEHYLEYWQSWWQRARDNWPPERKPGAMHGEQSGEFLEGPVMMGSRSAPPPGSD